VAAFEPASHSLPAPVPLRVGFALLGGGASVSTREYMNTVVEVGPPRVCRCLIRGALQKPSPETGTRSICIAERYQRERRGQVTMTFKPKHHRDHPDLHLEPVSLPLPAPVPGGGTSVNDQGK
jgi:hypothetical protein